MSNAPRRPVYGPKVLDGPSWWENLLRELQHRGLPCEAWSPRPVLWLGRLLSRHRWLRNLHRGRRTVVHLTAMASTSTLFPRGLWNDAVFVCMDCWGSQWDDWEKVFRRNRVQAAAFTARHSQEEMQRRLPDLKTFWLPEAIEHPIYPAGPSLSERSIDLLEMGRLYAAFHDAVAPAFAQANKRHVFPKPGQHYMFKDHAEIRAAIADTKLMVCYPRCDTHPEQAGHVETLTLRYLEGFVSRCLVVGRAPQELIDIFGYDPVIPLDVTQPPEQLAEEALGLLDRLDEFQSMVDRNRETAIRLCDWGDRADTLLSWLESLDYAVRPS